MRTCRACNNDRQPDEARFCFECGSALDAPACRVCGAELVPGARFCSGCGADQQSAEPVAGETGPVAARRVTSVLFADLVGFTTLSESRDSEQVRELLSRYFADARTVIGRYGGTVEKFIGDAVMAVWGVPTTHEDDAERAVRAGLELLDAVTRLGEETGHPGLAMRVGIVTGEVAVTIGATHEGMVAGDAVNTAARVQSIADPGQVWVDDLTRSLTASAIAYRDTGTHNLKGKAEPVSLWAVDSVIAGVGGEQRVDGLEAPLIGRVRELRMVKEVLNSVVETGAVAAVVIDGEPGVGKTRLGWEVDKYLDGLSAGTLWHQGRCVSFGEGVAFSGLAEAVRARFSLLTAEAAAHDSPTELRTAALDALSIDPEERTWLEPRLGVLLGDTGSVTGSREELFAAWLAFFDHLSHRRVGPPEPVVWVIEDAQHADDGLLAFVEYLLAEARFPLFVLLLARPALIEANPWLATNRKVTVVHLEPLDPEQTAELVDALVTGLDPEVRDAIAERSEGIPLYAVETIRSLIDRDLVIPSDGRYVLAPGSRIDLDQIAAPASLQALVAARLDRLTPTQRRVIDRASIAGRTMSRSMLDHLCPDVPDLDDVLLTLVRAQLLARDTSRFSADAGSYRFVQAVVQQVAYATLSRRDRKAGHLAAASLLAGPANHEPSPDIAALIAQHHLDAADAVPEDPDAITLTATAVDHLLRAADRAEELGSTTEALTLVRIAFARVAEPSRIPQVRARLAHALWVASEYDEGMTVAARARDELEAAGDEVGAAGAALSLGRLFLDSRPEPREAVAAFGDHFERLSNHPEAISTRLHIGRMLAHARQLSGLPHDELTIEVARLAARTDDPLHISASLLSLGNLLSAKGCREAAIALYDATLASSPRGEHARISAAQANLAIEWSTSDLVAAAAVGRLARESARRSGMTFVDETVCVGLSPLLVISGDWDEALEAARPIDRGPIADLVRSFIALAKQDELSPPPDPNHTDPYNPDQFWPLSRAARAVHAGNLGSVAGEALLGLTTFIPVEGFTDTFTIVYALATELVASTEDHELLQPFLTLIDEPDEPQRVPFGVRAQHALLTGRRELHRPVPDADLLETSLRTGVAMAEQWHAEPLLAHGRRDLGLWLARQGDLEEARTLLAQARATYERLGAHRWLADLDARSRVALGAVSRADG